MFRPKPWGAGLLIAMRDTFDVPTPFCQKSLLGLYRTQLIRFYTTHHLATIFGEF